ncbi:Rad1/Rec1/Rad17 [Phaeosphaeriaceae sp. PMI808]|nr:Rad1/Rec1/Rad17 [Phaeosphaeriaceae sp. PMI808]
MDKAEHPILTAVSSSVRQLFLLLRCIAFSDKAHVTINEEGLKIAVDEVSAMEASTFLNKSLFTTYNFHPPTPIQHPTHSDSEEDIPEPTTTPNFQISLPALLETLQIFGLTDPSTKPSWARDSPYPTSTAFSNNVLGINNLCHISYPTPGSPLSIILTESSIRTTCALTTYQPSHADSIPFDRRAVILKTIIPSPYLYSALTELSSTSPSKLSLVAKFVGGKPYFALSATGTLGEARVEFNNREEGGAGRRGGGNREDGEEGHGAVLETFQLADVEGGVRASYGFALVQRAARAMGVAAKVSVRVDAQGVLSMQFMVAMEGGAGPGAGGAEVSFVDFCFVPLVDDEDDDDDDDEGDGDEAVVSAGENGA